MLIAKQAETILLTKHYVKQYSCTNINDIKNSNYWCW